MTQTIYLCEWLTDNCIVFCQFSLKYRSRIFGHDRNAQKYGFISLFTQVMTFFEKQIIRSIVARTNETLC